MLCAVSPTSLAECRNALVMCTVGRVWGKVYCRSLSERDPSREIVVVALQNMVRQFGGHLADEDALCSRCKGDTGLPSKACLPSSADMYASLTFYCAGVVLRVHRL